MEYPTDESVTDVPAQTQARALVWAQENGPRRIDRLRAYLQQLTAPTQLTPEQARGALWILNRMRRDTPPDHPRLMRLLTPSVRLNIGDIQELGGPGTPRSSARRMAQELRDEGLLLSEGAGVYAVAGKPEVIWPETDRKAGWVITKAGNLYAL